jgi:uncharacterized repeat protein (TIGR01451 family)
MNNKTGVVKLFKNNEVGELKKAEVNYSLFSEGVLQMTKSVDRPEEYYVEGDPINFTITIKNVGDKTITDFKLKDEVEEYIQPFGDNFKVTASKGQIVSYANPVTVEGITLQPKESMTVRITGKIAQ